MPNSRPSNLSKLEPLVVGIGVAGAFGLGKEKLIAGLRAGENRFSTLGRPGRCLPGEGNPFFGTEIPEETDFLPRRVSRNSTLTARTALTVVKEALEDAGLSHLDPERVGLVVGGSNVQNREWMLFQQQFQGRESFIRPSYGYGFLDSDPAGLCSEFFQIRGFIQTCGAASASGALAVIQAAEAIEMGKVDCCIALGALQDVSYYELQGFRALGALAEADENMTADRLCRPFDQDHRGFVFGEASAALVLMNPRLFSRLKPKTVYAHIRGKGLCADGNRKTNPSLEGEVRAMELAFREAHLSVSDIDYINPHGTGSALGDQTELQAYKQLGLTHAAINTTKSVLGHGLSAAGAVEAAVTLLQMKHRFLHPCRNLEHPMDTGFDWVTGEARSFGPNTALSLSLGFGGINTALIFESTDCKEGG